MGYYDDIYIKRVNRYGYNYQSRLQGEREYSFEQYLLKSVYRINFEYEFKDHPAIFEPYKQDETELLHYLLTRVNLEMPNGTILMLPDKNHILNPWMIYWKESYKASGYNRYILIRMTHEISWVDRDHQRYTTWAYMYGQEDNMLKDELKSRSRMDVLYNENLKTSFFIAPANAHLHKMDYFTVTTEDVNREEIVEGYRIVGYDVISTKGVGFITVDPVYLFDETSAPVQHAGDNQDDFFWLKSEEYNLLEQEE